MSGRELMDWEECNGGSKGERACDWKVKVIVVINERGNEEESIGGGERES